MIRKLLNIASALSLLMFVATAAMWIRSYFDDDDFVSIWMSLRLGGIVTMASSQGVVSLDWEGSGDGLGPTREPEGWSHFGVFVNRLQRDPITTWILELHYWDLLVLSLVVPTACLIATRVRRRPLDGVCHSCGYDLIPSPSPVIAILPEEQQPTPPP